MYKRKAIYKGGNHVKSVEGLKWGTPEYHFASAFACLRSVRFWKQMAQRAEARGNYVNARECHDKANEMREAFRVDLNKAWELRREREARQLPAVIHPSPFPMLA